jgi:transcriptional regulator with XRE-family HTH domain
MASRGQRLVEAMQLRGYAKQHALAYALGVNESTITRWKNDGPMTLDNVVMLCRLLDVSVDWFLNGTGSLNAHNGYHPAANTPLALTIRRAELVMTDRAQAMLVAFIDEILPAP